VSGARSILNAGNPERRAKSMKHIRKNINKLLYGYLITCLFSLVIVLLISGHVCAEDAFYIDEKGNTNIRGGVGINVEALDEQHFRIRPKKGVIPLNIEGHEGKGHFLSIKEDGTVFMDNNLGIGTKSPKTKLHLKDVMPYVRFDNTEIGYWDIFQNATSSADAGFIFQKNATTNFLVLGDGNNNSYFPTGNVGIGTKDPKAKLDVNGGMIYQGRYQRNDDPEKTYKISPRYHLSLTGKAYGGKTRGIPHSTLKELCADHDGCQVRLAMTRWNSDIYTESASVSFTFYYSQTGDGRWRAGAGIDHTSGIDGDGTTKHVANFYHTCYFTDGTYTDYKNEDDKEQGMQLLVWHGDEKKID
jgi:hypothetical protein